MLLAAQFDAGHYQYIRVTSPDGKVVASRESSASAPQAPAWFMALAPIEVSEGTAQVQDGWRQFGTLSLKSHSGFAYRSLWHGTLELLLWFATGATLCGILGTALLKRLLAPLQSVVEHAKGDRRAPLHYHPGILNHRVPHRGRRNEPAFLTGRQHAGREESARLEALRVQTQHDAVTGVLNRSHFLNIVDEALESENAPAGGLLAMIRMPELADLNREIGRDTVDAILQTSPPPSPPSAAFHQGWAVGA